MRRLAWPMLTLLLAACSFTPNYPTTTTTTPPPAASAPQPPAPISPGPRREAASGDQCGASALQSLVGRPRTEIPIPVDPSRQRVACTTCPVTLDYNPQRLNFFFDAETGIIKQVKCG